MKPLVLFSLLFSVVFFFSFHISIVLKKENKTANEVKHNTIAVHFIAFVDEKKKKTKNELPVVLFGIINLICAKSMFLNKHLSLIFILLCFEVYLISFITLFS